MTTRHQVCNGWFTILLMSLAAVRMAAAAPLLLGVDAPGSPAVQAAGPTQTGGSLDERPTYDFDAKALARLPVAPPVANVRPTKSEPVPEPSSHAALCVVSGVVGLGLVVLRRRRLA